MKMNWDALMTEGTIKKIEVTIPMKEFKELKVPFYLSISDAWERHCFKRLQQAGAPIKVRFIKSPVIERGRVYREDLIEENAVRIVWEDDNEQSIQD